MASFARLSEEKRPARWRPPRSAWPLTVAIAACFLGAAAGVRSMKGHLTVSGSNRSTLSGPRIAHAAVEQYCKDIGSYICELGSQCVLGENAVAFGNVRGTQCYAESDLPVLGGIGVNQEIMLFSSSKWVFTYTVLKLVDLKMISLDTRPADLFDWWTKDDNDVRSAVTLRHLITQTDGMGMYFKVALAVGCIAEDTLGCARQAYDTTFSQSRPPGSKFIYTETSFYVASAMALAVTGLKTLDEVFRQYMADPLGMSPTCRYDFPNKKKAYAGGGLNCNMGDYTKFMTRLAAKTLVSKELHEEAEKPHTLKVKNWPPPDLAGFFKRLVWAPSVYYHYGFGQWLECAEADCSGGVLRTNCIGAAGTFPWISREKGEEHWHWGVVARRRLGGYGPMSMEKIYDTILPKVAAAYGVARGDDSQAGPARAASWWFWIWITSCLALQLQQA